MKCFFTQNLYSCHICFCKGYLPRGRPGKNLFRSWEQGLAGLNKTPFAENHVVVLFLFVLFVYEQWTNHIWYSPKRQIGQTNDIAITAVYWKVIIPIMNEINLCLES